MTDDMFKALISRLSRLSDGDHKFLCLYIIELLREQDMSIDRIVNRIRMFLSYHNV